MNRAKRFVLWLEVVMAYLSPAVMAGIGGLITADRGLQLAAFTTIGGTSAAVAWLLGRWLLRRGMRSPWLVRSPRLVAAGVLAVAGSCFGLQLAWMITVWFDGVWPSQASFWLGRIRTDFPVSAAIACAIMAWRWKGSFASEKN